VALDYLTVADVLGMHTVLIRRYGGLPGVIDPGALEAALYRPQTGYYKDTIEQAAALMESLAINHPFVDGNKRIAFAATDVFLRINDFKLTRQPAQIYAELISMLDHRQLNLINVDAWLRGFAADTSISKD
jgi:death-on-curing protein